MRTYKADQFNVSPEVYRKAYNKWLAAVKRGHDVPLEAYFSGKRVQFKTPKPKIYYVQRRALQVARATPKWVDIEEIATFYAKCPEGYQVDHIVPINGENVSGLHIMANLQYLSVEEHKAKTYRQSQKHS